jgi:glutamate/tyrosine decarboxylase-like PLP-dependent enzyme
MTRRIPSLPLHGISGDDILGTCREIRRNDEAWVSQRHGQMTIWSQSPRAATNAPFQDIAIEAARTFFWDSQSFVKRQPSQQRFKSELGTWIAELTDAPAGHGTTATMGGTESNMLAIWAAIQRAKAIGKAREPFEIVAPATIHVSIVKGAAYFGVKLVKAPLGNDFRCDPAAIERLVNDHTIAIAGSAPEYCYGLYDPLEELARIARERNLWFHIDSCVGGTISKLAHDIDPTVPFPSFAIPGVCSISVDLHKHTFGPMGLSILVFARDEDRERSEFRYDDWACGLFVAPTMNGGRPAHVLSSTWALWQALGETGLKDLVALMLKRRDQVLSEISALPGGSVFGNPRLTVIGFTSNAFDIYAAADLMAEKGWWLDRLQRPNGLHLNVDAFHEDDLVPCYFAALREAGESLGQGARARQRGEAGYLV